MFYSHLKIYSECSSCLIFHMEVLYLLWSYCKNIYFKRGFCFYFVRMYECLHVHVCATCRPGVRRGQKRPSDLNWSYRQCEPPDIGSGNGTWILCKSSKWGWRYDSVVKSAGCSFSGPRFDSQNPHGTSQLTLSSDFKKR